MAYKNYLLGPPLRATDVLGPPPGKLSGGPLSGWAGESSPRSVATVADLATQKKKNF